MGSRRMLRIWKFGLEYIPGFYIAIKKRIQYDSNTWGWKVLYKKYL